MKFAYKVFHLDKDIERIQWREDADKYLNPFCTEFDTPTIHISNKLDLDYFKINNPSFNIDPYGYNLHNEQGWKWGEIGIWASNWLAWNKFLDSEYDNLILMEDDITIYPQFEELLYKYIEQLPVDWEILHLFVPGDQHNKYEVSLDVSEDLCKVYQDWSCLCYVINKKGAKRLIETSAENIRLPLDWHMFRQTSKFKIFTLKPFSEYGCTLTESESTFQNKQSRAVI